MSSLTIKNQTAIQIGNYLARRNGDAYSVTGCVPVTKGRKFTLVLLQSGTLRLSGKSSTGSRKRNWIKALSIDAAIEEAEKILYGGNSEPEDSALTVAKVCWRWIDTRSCSEETLKEYRKNVRYFLDWLDTLGVVLFSDLKPEHIQKYALDLAKDGKQLKTIKHYCYPVRAICRWASLNWESFRDVSQGFSLPRLKQIHHFETKNGKSFIPFDSLADYLLWLREKPDGWNLLPGVALQGLCALRMREALRLTWNKVDFKKGTIIVDGIVKNEHSVRCLPLPELAWEILKQTPREDDRVVFAYDHSNPFGKAVRRSLKRWNETNTVEPKGLRRTLITTAKRQRWHSFFLERYIGHSPGTITDRDYVAGEDEDHLPFFLEEIVAPINQILKSSTRKWQRNGNSGAGSKASKS